MKINLLKGIKDYEGKEIKKEKDEILTLRDVFSIALNSQVPDEKQTAEQKNKIFQLSLKLYKDKEADFTLDDRSFIKERVGKAYNALVYGRVCEVLEEKEEK